RKYHQSEIQTFLKCGKQWEFRYLLGMKTPPKAALTVGSAVDRAVTKNMIAKIQTGELLPKEAVLDAYSTSFDSLKTETAWGDDDPGKQKDVGAQLVAAHSEKLAPGIEPDTVQEEFVIETDGGYDLGGTIDLTEKNGFVVDTKTAKSAYDADAVSTSIQAGMYDFAYEALKKKPAAGFRFDVLIKPTKTIGARVQQVSGKVEPGQRTFLFDAINQMHKAISAGVALPAPEGAWWCSPDWCGYWAQCKGKK